MGILDPPSMTQSQSDSRYLAGNDWRAMTALGNTIPSRQPAITASPMISWNTSVPAATPTQRAAYLRSTSVYNPGYTLSGHPYVRAGVASPEWDAVQGEFIVGNGTVNIGSTDADFISDSPSIAIPYYRAQAGSIRILVDGVEVIRVVGGIRSATAQAGGATTITLDSGSSSSNGFYITRWINITGGTGAGQQRQITGYVGSTKVATVGVAWATNPDSTSTFMVSATRATWPNNYTTSTNLVYLQLDWSGERRMRRYRVEVGGSIFLGCYTMAVTDQLVSAPKPTGTRCIWLGDSFSEGTGSEIGEGLSTIASRMLGWELWNISVGGTGYLNPITTGASMPFGLRCFPPVNAWYWVRRASNNGNVTFTQGSTSVTFASNAITSAIQTAFDGAFGAGQFAIYGGSASSNTNAVWVVGLGSIAALATAMTIDSTYTAANPGARFARWTGDLAPCIPKDGAGNALPFVIVLAGGHNDTTGTNAAFTTTALQTEVSSLLTKLRTAYPTAKIIVAGIMYLPGSTASTNAGAWDTAIQAAVTVSASKVNGQVPFLALLDLFSGSGYLGSLQANGTSDFATHTDGVHPSPIGHHTYGNRIATLISAMLGHS